MNTIVEKLMGVNELTDQMIASDFLLAAKTGVKQYAAAITETATPEIREVLHRHLTEAIQTHEQITAYMIDRGFYYPWNPQEQLQLDLKTIQTALTIPS